MTSSPPRRLIHDDECIVVIDTSPIRNIAEKGFVPPWVEIFAAMAKEGYSFSLGDATFAELLFQRQSDRLQGDYDLMISSIFRFLNPEFPVLPGKIDLMQMIGAKPLREGWSEAQVRGMSQAAWKMLRDAQPQGTKFTRFLIRIWMFMTRFIRRGETLEEMLQAERDDWIGIFKTFEAIWVEGGKMKLNEYKHRDLEEALRRSDHGEGVIPSMSIRCDFQMRFLWRQFVRSQKDRHAYNPLSQKKKNDGIDFDFLRYLSLPALFLAEEKAFAKNAIKDIPSFQTGWVWTPQSLADAWARGERPWPEWPRDVQ